MIGIILIVMTYVTAFTSWSVGGWSEIRMYHIDNKEKKCGEGEFISFKYVLPFILNKDEYLGSRQ